MTQSDTLSKKVGKNLKNLIKKSKFVTQENFALEMNVDPATVRRWIANGIKNLDVIEEIANKLCIDFYELLL